MDDEILEGGGGGGGNHAYDAGVGRGAVQGLAGEVEGRDEGGGLAPAPGDGGASGDVSVIAQPDAACRLWKRLHRRPFAGKTATFLHLNGNT